MKPIALIIPWYGDDAIGGAEKECNYLAQALQNAGQKVEVFTTCVKNVLSDMGKNAIKPGTYTENEITVKRFPVRENRDIAAYINSNERIYKGDNFSLEDEEVYFREDMNSPEMYAYIRENKDKYRAFLLIPYMYGVVYNASFECIDKSILIPCLHNESYAYMSLMKEKMKTYKGMIFLSMPEYELAKSIYDLSNVKTAVPGGGIDTGWKDSVNPKSFREKYNINDEFILFAGRKDAGKKADELAAFFMRFKDENPSSKLKLVYLGGGELPIEIPDRFEDDILDLGFVSVEDKQNAFAAAAIFCNPSHFESFSLVIMESWIAKRPVLVSGFCDVTKHFCIESNGGLYYNGYDEFYYCVKYLLENTQIADKMGENGHLYVMSHFTHDIIAEKYLRFIEETLE